MKIALLGYGKMGKTIETLALQKGHEVVFKSTSDSSQGNFNLADVAIEFSVPEMTVPHLKKCFEANIPVVCGTTGWLSDLSTIEKHCQKRNGSFIYASNFSIGVNLFFTLNEDLARLMKPWQDYSVEVEEIHHTEKKDAPSGTAISLAEGILPYTNKKNWSLDIQNKEALHIEAIRKEDVKGTHLVSYRSSIDTITIQHEAHTRDGFAIGAIIAAEYLKDKTGIFTMKDVLGL